jgi:glycosyltransferase involved in cell wall biosynthesis
MNSISVFFPAYNEGKNIRKTIEKAQDVLRGICPVFEIIVVDDGSRDDTADIVRDIMIKNPEVRLVQHSVNQGYGQALQSGIEASKYEYIFFSDADLQFDIGELHKFVEFIPEYDAVIGYRKKRRDRFIRILNARMWNIANFLAFGLRARDIDCAFKLIKSSILKKISLHSKGALISSEMLLKLSDAGAKIKELPVTHYPRNFGTPTGGNIGVIFKAFIEMGKLYFELRRSVFDWFIYIFIPTVILFFPVLFLGKIFLLSDDVTYMYPLAFYFKTHYESIWSVLFYGGFPLISSFHYGFFNPLYNIFFQVFDSFFAVHFILFLDIIAASIFTYKTARDFRISKQGSLLVSLTYVFCQFNVNWMFAMIVTNSLWVLPALAFFTHRLIRKPHHLWLLGIVTGLGFLTAHYQFMFMALCFVAVLSIYIIWQSRMEDLKKSIEFLFYVAMGILIGMIIGIPQILNTLRFFDLTYRSAISVFVYASPLDVLRYIIPNFNITNFSSQEFLPYIGIPGLLCVFISYIYLFRKDRWVFFYGSLSIFIFLLFFHYSPIAMIVEHIPIFSYIIQPARWLFVMNFALAILAGFGFDGLISKMADPIWRRKLTILFKWLTFVIGGLSLIFTIVRFLFISKILAYITNYFDLKIFPTKNNGFSLDYYHKILELLVRQNLDNFTWVNVGLLAFILVNVSILIVLYNYEKFVNKLTYIFISVAAINMYIVSAFYGPFFKVITDKSVLTNTPETISFIKSRETDPYSYRVFSFLLPFAQYQKILATEPNAIREATEFAVAGLVPNTGIMHGIPTLGGNESNGESRIQSIVAELEGGNDDLPLAEKIAAFAAKTHLLSRFNVKYLLTPYKIDNSKNLVLLKAFEVGSFKVPLYLYENKTVRPMIFSPSTVKYLSEKDEDASFVAVMHSNATDTSVYIECDTCIDQKTPTNFEMKGNFRIVKQDDQNIVLHTTYVTSHWIIFSQNKTPGWKIYIDDRNTESFFADHTFHAVLVPAGEHDVIFAYNLL